MNGSPKQQWVKTPLKFLFESRIAGAWGDDSEGDEGTICIRAADFLTHQLSHSKASLTRRKYDERDLETRQLVIGDLILEKSGGGEKQPVGRIVSFELTEKALCSNFLERLRPESSRLFSRYGAYLLYYLWSNRIVIPFIKQTTGIQNLDADAYFSLIVEIPDIVRQRSIATYLDQHTARFDELIAAKQYLLDLLAEKRQALITHAVTRGLDPAAPLRDSGVPRLGEIPAHWEVVNLKFLADVRTGVAKGRTLDSSRSVKLPYLRVANVQDGYIDLSDVAEIEVLPEEISNYQLRQDDVLMNEGGDADKLGRGAVWDGSIDPCLHQNHVFAVRCHAVSPIWLSTITGSDYAKAYFESHSKQSTNLASISATNLKELPVVLPPKHEQMQLVHWIDNNLTTLNNLQIATRKTVELLQERRSALIAAAVNGQIDVTEQPCN